VNPEDFFSEYAKRALVHFDRAPVMQYVPLGESGLLVSRVCAGTLSVGPATGGLDLEEGAALLAAAFSLGINFVDTAEIYQNYAAIRKALGSSFNAGEVIVATKSYAHTWDGMSRSLDLALNSLGVDRIGLFLLHEQESASTIRGHWRALERLLKAKAEGTVGAVGLSSHCPGAVEAAAHLPEIDVIHPLINKEGIGLKGGGLQHMVRAVGSARRAGKGIYAMKALAGGHLASEAHDALRYVSGLECVDSVAVGFCTPEELAMDVALVLGADVPASLREKVKARSRRLVIEPWCSGCGSCVRACPSGALRLEEGVARVRQERCVFCGYCSRACPDFLIKVL